jgi:hypothetical protein
VVRAFSQPQVPDALRHAFEELATQTVYRLRNFLYQGALKAYYFGNGGCHSVLSEFWAEALADGVMESGTDLTGETGLSFAPDLCTKKALRFQRLTDQGVSFVINESQKETTKTAYRLRPYQHQSSKTWRARSRR